MEIPADVRMAFLRENVPFRRKITRKDAAGDILQHLFFRIIHKALRGRWFRFRKSLGHLLLWVVSFDIHNDFQT